MYPSCPSPVQRLHPRLADNQAVKVAPQPSRANRGCELEVARLAAPHPSGTMIAFTTSPRSAHDHRPRVERLDLPALSASM
ncbi:MAG: hypothetical protein U0841_04330 [Chloroflexia bacterium]